MQAALPVDPPPLQRQQQQPATARPLPLPPVLLQSLITLTWPSLFMQPMLLLPLLGTNLMQQARGIRSGS